MSDTKPVFHDAKPELKTLICEKHGEHQERAVQALSKWLVFSNCEKCSAEERVAEEKKQREEEISAAIARGKERRLQAGIPKRYIGHTFDQFNPLNDAQIKAKSKFERLSVELETGEAKNNLIVTGGVGTGKTLLASCLIDSVVNTISCEMVKCIDLVRNLKATWKRDSEQSETDLIEYYTSLKLLIIDEVGVQFGTDTERMFIFDVIDGRYQNELPTILISNQSVKGIGEVIGDRVIDRLRHDGGHLIVLDGPSQRK